MHNKIKVNALIFVIIPLLYNSNEIIFLDETSFNCQNNMDEIRKIKDLFLQNLKNQ